MSLQIVAVKNECMGFNRPQLREVSLYAFYRAEHLRNRRSRKVYKYVLYPRQSALQLIHLTPQSRAGVCLRHSISSSPLNQNRYFHCTDIYRIHRGLASKTVPVNEVVFSRSTVLTSPPIKDTRLRLAGPSVYAKMSLCHSSRLSRLYSPCVYSQGKSANMRVAGMWISAC
jgi:hypothetical protein